jgi:hypothetical protein
MSWIFGSFGPSQKNKQQAINGLTNRGHSQLYLDL